MDIQEKIDSLPKEHEPKNYKVRMNTKRSGEFCYFRYVRASSELRARYAALKVERDIFNKQDTVTGTAIEMTELDYK